MWKATTVGFICAISFFSGASAATCSGNPHTLTNGTTADADQVMDNFNNLLNCANNNLAPLANPSFSGNVGIGTSSPSWQLDVNGIVSSRGPGGQFTVYDRINVGDRTGLYRNNGKTGLWDSNNGDQFIIDNTTGNVGIGLTSPNQRLDVAGTIRQSGCTTAVTLVANASGDILCNTSDARLKKIQSQYREGLEAISRIQPVLFTYKAKAGEPADSFVYAGFVAQNVKAAIPQASQLQPNGYYSLDTTAILAAAVNAINELKSQNKDLSKHVKRQDGIIAELRKSLAALQHQTRPKTAAD